MRGKGLGVRDGRHTCITVASTAGFALSRVVADAVTVDVAGSEGVGAVCALAEAGGWGEGLILTDLQLTGDEVVEVSRKGAGSEKGDGEGMHLFLILELWGRNDCREANVGLYYEIQGKKLETQ